MVRLVSEEIVDQGGIATQSDLARLLGTSVRTIKRDIAYFRDHGITVLTRGVYSDIGAGVSHKRIIVEMYLSGMVYTEICRRMRHSARAVKRYVSTFARVVSLYEHGVQEVRDISYYVGISSRLAEEYVELYIHFKGYSHYRSRIEDLLVQLSSRPAYGEDSTKKKDMIGGMK
jgi:DNA-binding CsgD family transcriptional regulator